MEERIKISKKDSNRRYYIKNKQRILEKNKIYQQIHKKEIYEKRKPYFKVYNQQPNIKEKNRIKSKIYKLNNKEKVRTYQKEYRKKHREEISRKKNKYNKSISKLYKKGENKNKTWEEIYGKEKARIMKKNLSQKHKAIKTIPPSRKGKKVSKDIRDKISRIAKEKRFGKWMKGKKIPLEVREKISKTTKGRKGKPLTETTKQKIRIARRNQITPIKDSSIEIKVQNFLKKLGIEFFTHQYMKIKHGYQCDILIPSMNLVIECDGDYWHKYPIGREIDHVRTKELIQKGFKVLRLWEREIRVMDIKEFEKRIKWKRL